MVTRQNRVTVSADTFEAFDAGWRAHAPGRLRSMWRALHAFALRVLLLRPVPIAFESVKASVVGLELMRLSAWAQAWALLSVWPEYQQRLLEPDSRAIVDSAEGIERGAADALMWWTQFGATERPRGQETEPKYGAHALGEGLALAVLCAVRAGRSEGQAHAAVIYALASGARGHGVPLEEPEIVAELVSAFLEVTPKADRWTASERREALGIILHGYGHIAGLVATEPNYMPLLAMARASEEGGAR